MIFDLKPRFRCLALLLALASVGDGWAEDQAEGYTKPAKRNGKAEEISAASSPTTEASPSVPRSSTPRIPRRADAIGNITVELAVRHDDNIFLTDTEQVSDTIISATPGVEFRFGRDAQIHGSFTYKEAFTRYADQTVANAALGSGRANIGYTGARLVVSGAVSFQQLYQPNRDLAGQGQKAVYRSDVLNIQTSAESHFSTKTSVMVGANYSRTEYKTAGLIGSRDIAMPLRFYYKITPKVDLSTGFTYRKVKPQEGGNESRDLDYNIGARGNFTPKLTGEFSVGHTSREVGNNPGENLWSFDGSFGYEITPKTTSSLALSRDFGVGAQGASLQTTSYAVRLSTVPTPQWQFGTGITYRRVAYGPNVFTKTPAPPPTVARNDNYWECSLLATYIHSAWLSTSAEYTLSANRSTLPGPRYSGNVLSLLVGWRY
jgi:polysaccharide biosynthesis protein VpsM